ncbi:hypothetical protein FBUS_10809 [Fasciolopsis buskii]|uniref:Uncharacterized protein n=1 Tax=Fasciolopsis buskii TaxID=27845 RepID=A0A8E0RLZ3_9TREM|nr:hypothetical protein FBUS_10809 [Fasciolopsis buski]
MTHVSTDCHGLEKFTSKQQNTNDLDIDTNEPLIAAENLTRQISRRELRCRSSGRPNATSQDNNNDLICEGFRCLSDLVGLKTGPMKQVAKNENPVCYHWRYTEREGKRRRTFSYPTSSRPFRLFPLPQSTHVKRICPRCEMDRIQASGVNFGDVSLAATSRSNTLMSGLTDWAKVRLIRPSSQTFSFVEEQVNKPGQGLMNKIDPTELQLDSMLDMTDKTKVHGSPFSWIPDISSQMDVSLDFQSDCNEPPRSGLSSAADQSSVYRTVTQDSQQRLPGSETFYFTPRERTQSIPWPSDSQPNQRNDCDLSPKQLRTAWTPSTNSVFSFSGATYHTPTGVIGFPNTGVCKLEMEKYEDALVEEQQNRIIEPSTRPEDRLEGNEGSQFTLLSGEVDKPKSKEYDQCKRTGFNELSSRTSLERDVSGRQRTSSQHTADITAIRQPTNGTSKENRVRLTDDQQSQSQFGGYVYEQKRIVDQLDIDSEFSNRDPDKTITRDNLSVACLAMTVCDEQTESEGSQMQSTPIPHPLKTRQQRTTYVNEQTANLVDESFDNWAQQKPYCTLTASEYLTNSDTVDALQETSIKEDQSGQNSIDIAKDEGLNLPTSDQPFNFNGQNATDGVRTKQDRTRKVEDKERSSSGSSNADRRDGRTGTIETFDSVISQSVTLRLCSPYPGSPNQEVHILQEIELSNIPNNKHGKIRTDTTTKATQLIQRSVSPNQRTSPSTLHEIKTYHRELGPIKAQGFTSNELDGKPKFDNHTQINDEVNFPVVSFDPKATVNSMLDNDSPGDQLNNFEDQVIGNEASSETRVAGEFMTPVTASNQDKTKTLNTWMLDDSQVEDQPEGKHTEYDDPRNSIQSNLAQTQLGENTCIQSPCETPTADSTYRFSGESRMDQSAVILETDEQLKHSETDQLLRSAEILHIPEHDEQSMLRETIKTIENTMTDSPSTPGFGSFQKKNDKFEHRKSDYDLSALFQSEIQSTSEIPIEPKKSPKRSWKLNSISRNLDTTTLTEPQWLYNEQTHARTVTPETVHEVKYQMETDEEAQDIPAARRRSLTITDPHFTVRDHLTDGIHQRQIRDQKIKPTAAASLVRTIGSIPPEIVQEESELYREKLPIHPRLPQSYSASTEILTGGERTDSSIRVTTTPEFISHDFVSEMEEVSKSLSQDRLRSEISYSLTRADQLITTDESISYSETNKPGVQTVITSDESVKGKDEFDPRQLGRDKILNQMEEQFLMQNAELVVLFDTDHVELTAFWTTVPHPEPNTTETVDPEAVQQRRAGRAHTLSAETPFRLLESASRHTVTFRCTPGTSASEVFTRTGMTSALEDIHPRLSDQACNMETPRKDISSTEPRRECQTELRVIDADGLDNRFTPLKLDVRLEQITGPKCYRISDQDRSVVRNEGPVQYKPADGLRLNNKSDDDIKTPKTTLTPVEPMCYFEQVSEHSEGEERSALQNQRPNPDEYLNRWVAITPISNNRKGPEGKTMTYSKARTSRPPYPEPSEPRLETQEIVVTIKSSIELRTQIASTNGRTSVTTNTTVYSRSPTPIKEDSQTIIHQVVNGPGKTNLEPILDPGSTEDIHITEKTTEEETKVEEKRENSDASLRNIASGFVIKRDSIGAIRADDPFSSPTEVHDPSEIQSPEPNFIDDMILPESVTPCELNHDQRNSMNKSGENHGKHGHLAWRESNISELFDGEVDPGYDQGPKVADFNPSTCTRARKLFNTKEPLATSMIPQNKSTLSQRSQTVSDSVEPTISDEVEIQQPKISIDEVNLVKPTLQDDYTKEVRSSFTSEIKPEVRTTAAQDTILFHDEVPVHDMSASEALKIRQHIQGETYSLARTTAPHKIDESQCEPTVTTRRSTTSGRQPLEILDRVCSFQLMDMIPNYKISMESTVSSYYTARSSLTGLNRFGITSTESDVIMPEIECNEGVQKPGVPRLEIAGEKIEERPQSHVATTKQETDELSQTSDRSLVYSTKINNRENKDYVSHIKTKIGGGSSDVAESNGLNFDIPVSELELNETGGFPAESANKMEKMSESEILVGQKKQSKSEQKIDARIAENKKQRDGTEKETEMILQELADKPLETTKGFSQQLDLIISHDTDEIKKTMQSDFVALAGAYYRASLNKEANAIEKDAEQHQPNKPPHVQSGEFKPQSGGSGSIETNRSARGQINNKANDIITATIFDRTEQFLAEREDLEAQDNKDYTFVKKANKASLETHNQFQVVYDGKNLSVMSLRQTNTARLGRSTSVDRRRKQEWSSDMSIGTGYRFGSSVSLPNLTETVGHPDISNQTTQGAYVVMSPRSYTMNIQAGLGHSSAGRPSSPFEWSLGSTAFVPYSNATTSSESALPTSPTGHKLAQLSDTQNPRRPFGVKARHVTETPANHNAGSFRYRKGQSNSNLPSPTGRADRETPQSRSGSRSRISQVQITISQRVRRSRGHSREERKRELLALKSEQTSGLSPTDPRAVSPTEVSSNIERDPEEYTVAREITDQAIHKAIGRFCSSSPTMLSSANTESGRETDSIHDGEVVATVTGDYDMHVSSSVDIRENARSPVTVTMGSAQENSFHVSPSMTPTANGSPVPRTPSPLTSNQPGSPGSLSIQADVHVNSISPVYDSRPFSTGLQTRQEISVLKDSGMGSIWMSNVSEIGGSHEAPCQVTTIFDIRVTARNLQTPSGSGALQHYDPRSQRLALPMGSSPSPLPVEPVESVTPEISTGFNRPTARDSPRVGDSGTYENGIRTVEDQQCQLSSSMDIHTVTRTSLIVSSPALPRGHVAKSPTLSPIITTPDDHQEVDESVLQRTMDTEIQKAPPSMIKTNAGDLSKAGSPSPKPGTRLSMDKSALVESPTSIQVTNPPDVEPVVEFSGLTTEDARQNEDSVEGQLSPSPEPTIDLPDIVSPMSGETMSYENPEEKIQTTPTADVQQTMEEDNPVVVVDTELVLEAEEVEPVLATPEETFANETQPVRIVSYAVLISEDAPLEDESPEGGQQTTSPHFKVHTEVVLETADGKQIPLEASPQTLEVTSGKFVEQEDGTRTYRQAVTTGPIEIGGKQIEIMQTVDVIGQPFGESAVLRKQATESEIMPETTGTPPLMSPYVSDTDAIAQPDADRLGTMNDTKSDTAITATNPTTTGQIQISQPTTDLGQQEIKETPAVTIENIEPLEEEERTQDKEITPIQSPEVTMSEIEKNVTEQKTTVPEPEESARSPDVEADFGAPASQSVSPVLPLTGVTETEANASEQARAETPDDRHGRTTSIRSETSVQIPGESKVPEAQPPPTAAETPAKVSEQVPQIGETDEKLGEKRIETPAEQTIQMTPETDEPVVQTAEAPSGPEVPVSIGEQKMVKQQEVVEKPEIRDDVQEEQIPPTSTVSPEVATIQEQQTPVIKIGEQTRVASPEAADGENPNLSKASSQAEKKTVSPEPDNEVQAESLVGEVSQQERKDSQEQVENIPSMDENVSKKLASTEQIPDTLAGAETIPLTETPREGGRPGTSAEEKEENTVVTKVDMDGEVEQPFQQYEEKQSDQIRDPAQVGEDEVRREEEITVQPPVPQTLSETAMLEDTMAPVDVEPIPTDQPREQIVEASQMETQPSSIRETDYQEQAGESKLASEAIEEKSIAEITEVEKQKMIEPESAEVEELQLPETKDQQLEQKLEEVTEVRPELSEEQAAIAKQTETPFKQSTKLTLPIEIQQPPENMERTEGKSVITEVATEIEINIQPGQPPEVSVRTVTTVIPEQSERKYDLLSPEEPLSQQMLASGGMTDTKAEATALVEGAPSNLMVSDRDGVTEESREVHQLDALEKENGNEEQHQEGIPTGATVETTIQEGNIGMQLSSTLVAEGNVESTADGMLAGLRDVDVRYPTSMEADEGIAQTEAQTLIQEGQTTITTSGIEEENIEQRAEQHLASDKTDEQMQPKITPSSESDINVVGFAIQKIKSTDDLLSIGVSGRELLVNAAKDMVTNDEGELNEDLKQKLEGIVDLNEQINQIPEPDQMAAVSGMQGQQPEEQNQPRPTTSSESDINVVGFAIQKIKSTDDLLSIGVSGRELLVNAAKDMMAKDGGRLSDSLKHRLEEIVDLEEEINQVPQKNDSMGEVVAGQFSINARFGRGTSDCKRSGWKFDAVSEIDIRFSKNADTTSTFTVKADVNPTGEVPTICGTSRELSEPTTSFSERRIVPSRHSRGIRTREDSDSLDRHFNALMYGRARQTIESSERPKAESTHYQAYTARRMHRVEKVVNALDALILETIQYIKQNLPPRE